jgi:hypothetical protein
VKESAARALSILQEDPLCYTQYGARWRLYCSVSELIGENGRLNALDVMPVALEMVDKLTTSAR